MSETIEHIPRRIAIQGSRCWVEIVSPEGFNGNRDVITEGIQAIADGNFELARKKFSEDDNVGAEIGRSERLREKRAKHEGAIEQLQRDREYGELLLSFIERSDLPPQKPRITPSPSSRNISKGSVRLAAERAADKAMLERGRLLGHFD